MVSLGFDALFPKGSNPVTSTVNAMGGAYGLVAWSERVGDAQTKRRAAVGLPA
jgi:hypothetical protein